MLLCGCQHKIVSDADFTVILDSRNTYREGDPVSFLLRGDVENLVFYSGENENEEGIAIKNIQSSLPSSYEYTWQEPGSYKVTFIGTNCNYLDSSRQVYELLITILEVTD